MVTKTAKIKARPDPSVDEMSDEEPDFSDPEGFVDDINDEDLLEDLYRERPAEADGLESVIVVDNIPVVTPERLEKLKSVLHKTFSPFGETSSWEFPIDEETGKTKGFVFIEYRDAAGAQEAVQRMNGYKLDKNHMFAVCPFTDFQKYEALSEDWRPPQPQPYPYEQYGNLSSYLQEPDCRDQFVVTSENGRKVSMYLHGFQEDTPLFERDNFTELGVMWSPKGTYLASFHEQGIQLWGGENFEKIHKFKHYKVRLIDFSPCERYLVTFNEGVHGAPIGKGGTSDMNDDDRKPSVIVWDILTMQKKRTFQPSEQVTWPMFKWSHDDKYFARQTEDNIQIYETPSCGLLDKKSHKVTGVKSFSWCPTLNIMAYWVAEDRDVPARVNLLEIPSRQELRSKNLFNVADCKMCWQKNGDYLAVKVDRFQKSKKEGNVIKYSGMYFNFEVFMIREKNIPVDSVELKDSCVNQLAWEPNGSKFAVVHGEGQHSCVSFYQVKSASVTLLKRMEKKLCNRLLWSPSGQFIVLGGLKTLNGSLEFVDTANDFTIMTTAEHFRCTDVEWDPTGRYVVTSVSAWAGDRSDNAYWIWSFQGKILRKSAPTGFCQFQWRPRPRSLLTEDHIKEIKKNFKKYSQQFEVKDRASLTKVSKDIMEKRQKLMEHYRDWLADKNDKLLSQRSLRLELRGGVDTDALDTAEDPDDLEEETLFVLVKEESIALPA